MWSGDMILRLFLASQKEEENWNVTMLMTLSQVFVLMTVKVLINSEHLEVEQVMRLLQFRTEKASGLRR